MGPGCFSTPPKPQRGSPETPKPTEHIQQDKNGKCIENKPPHQGDDPNHTKLYFYVKALRFSKMKGKRGRGITSGKGVSYRLGSYLKSQNQKASFGFGPPALRRRSRPHGSTEAPRTFAKARRRRQLQNLRTDSKGLNPISRNQRKHEEGFSKLTSRRRRKGGRNSSLRA